MTIHVNHFAHAFEVVLMSDLPQLHFYYRNMGTWERALYMFEVFDTHRTGKSLAYALIQCLPEKKSPLIVNFKKAMSNIQVDEWNLFNDKVKKIYWERYSRIW